MLRLSVVGPVLIVAMAAGIGCGAEPAAHAPVETVFTMSPATWFEDGWSYYRVSPDGRRAVFGARFGSRLIELGQSREDSTAIPVPLDAVLSIGFGSSSDPIWLGVKARDTAWFSRGPTGPVALPIPPGAVPRWSPDTTQVAWYRPGSGELAVGVPERPRRYDVEGIVTGLEWSPSGELVYGMVLQADGSSSLVRVRVDADSVETIRRGLDAPPRFSAIGVSPDDKTLYLALASDTAPDPAARHRPDADRDTDIFALRLATGRLEIVVQADGDDFHPQVVANRLYWSHNELRDDIVVVPAAGGESRLVMRDAQIPYWSPDGSRLAFTVGGWRIADWALNLDAAAVRVDSSVRPVSEPAPIVRGYHEDFTPAWSPDGRWIVYHSHRSAEPVPGYGSTGSTDDLYLRRPDAPMKEEIRLTDFGWEVGVADWSPDGRRLVFDSWERGKPPGAKPWIATIDVASGQPRRIERLPLPVEVGGTLFLSWSPRHDREELAFVAEGEGTRQSLWITTPSGRGARKLLDYESSTYGGLDWTPDGERIVFAALTGGRMQLFVIERAGKAARQLTTDPASLLHPQVSPDGRWVAATQTHRTMQLRRLDRLP